MKIRTKIVTGLLLALSISCLATGCKKKTQETETNTETTRITEKQTESETTKKNTSATFKSKDGSLSIKLPDDTWEAKKEGTKEWTFESADQGIITIVHYSGAEMDGLVFPASEEEVLDNLEKAGKSKSDYAVVEYKKNTLGSYEAYHTTIKCKSASSKYAYSVAYNLVGDDDIYSVNGQVKQDDAKAMEAIRTSVESLKLLKSSGTTTSGSKKDNTKSSETSKTGQSESNSTNESNGNSQYIYDSNGNAVYVYQDSNGNWVDSSGAIYYFNSYGITNSNGVSFTYDKPDGTNSSDNNSGDNNGGNVQTNSFYDNQGNLISVYKNSSGNWVDSNGIVYTFGQYGVTDNYGNYYPYSNNNSGNGNNSNNNNNNNSNNNNSNNNSNNNNNNNNNNNSNGNTGSTNGFYDDQGNYISVTQDANGNWIDSGGMKYTFGNDGVTDANGYFYPY